MPSARVEPNVSTEPRVEILTVTRELARDWLTRNHESNRKMRPAKVAEYSADMRANRWVLSDQAISFNVAGDLINGQHRCKAVFDTGGSIRSLVLWNAPDRALLVIDGGMKRSTNDHFGMAGKTYPSGCGATVRRLLMGLTTFAGASISDWRVDEFMGQHGEAVRFVHTATQRHRISAAAVRAVLVRAMIGGTAGERVERFSEVLATGIMGPGENAAVLLRNHMTSLRSHASGSGTARAQLYALAESAFAAFLKREAVKKLQPVKTELFPVA